MARAVLVAALVLCAAAALAHAGRVVEEGERGSGLEASSWLQAPAEAPSRYAGGVKLRGLGSAGGYGGGFVDLLWSVFKLAKDAFATAVGWKD